ncbi:5-bromo-4-chloroindolyl phosphate hydrolysis family protein [Faecalibacterium duncaniae]|uniref:5-bromo-4-chloroindolyl phosphate hydrolysis family protein n=2 Tax=Faecalibacterium TaxID=216851 RepID=UPI003ED948C0
MGLRMKQARKLERQLDKIVGTRDNIPLDELFAAAGIDADRGRAAVERAIDHGYFGADAYIDNRTGTLVVRGAAPQPPRPAEPAPAPAPEDQYAALQRQLRQANDAIPDPVMTAKISRLEDVSARIFALAKKDPDKKAQLQKFMDYYLPTALKLLNTYAQLSAQDVQGSNITEAKQSIERSMDLLITAFENQLDKLFASDALDVSTDIAALEGMLNLDGLTGGDFAPRS